MQELVIDIEHDRPVNYHSDGPNVDRLPIPDITRELQSYQWDNQNNNWLYQAQEGPLEEYLGAEVLVVDTWFVELRVANHHIFLEFLVPSRVNDDGPRSEDQVESLGVNSLIEHLARKSRDDSVKNNWKVLHEIFVEHVANKIPISSLGLSSMVEYEGL